MGPRLGGRYGGAAWVCRDTGHPAVERGRKQLDTEGPKGLSPKVQRWGPSSPSEAHCQADGLSVSLHEVKCEEISKNILEKIKS